MAWEDPFVEDNLDGTFIQDFPSYQSRYVGAPGPLGSNDSDCSELSTPFWSFPPTRCICSEASGDAVYFAAAKLFLGYVLSDPIIDNLAPSVGAGNGLAAPITCSRAYQLANVGAYPGDLSMADVLLQLGKDDADIEALTGLGKSMRSTAKNWSFRLRPTPLADSDPRMQPARVNKLAGMSADMSQEECMKLFMKAGLHIPY